MAQGPVDVKVRGIRQLEAGAARLFRNIERAESTDAVRVTAEQVAATVRGRVPKRTGALAGSVRAVQRGKVWQVTMGAGLPYAGWIEFGGSRGRRRVARGRYEYPTAKRTERAFRKYAEQVCAQQIRSMRWPTVPTS